MASLKKPKTGRRASNAGPDRQLAKEWVDLYRRAQESPGGWLCLNPEDEPDEQSWIDGNDPGYLLEMLADFAKHGTFVSQDECVVRDFCIRLEARQRLAEERRKRAEEKKERTGEKALPSPVEKVAREMALSKRTLERILGKSAK